MSAPTRRFRLPCCARAANGQTIAALPRSVINPASCGHSMTWSAVWLPRCGHRDRCYRGVAQNDSTAAEAVALRDYDPAYDGFGSIATGRSKLQVQECPQCPVSDGRPEKGGGVDLGRF